MQDVGVGTIHSCIKGGPLKIERMYTRNDSCKIQIHFFLPLQFTRAARMQKSSPFGNACFAG